MERKNLDGRKRKKVKRRTRSIRDGKRKTRGIKRRKGKKGRIQEREE